MCDVLGWIVWLIKCSVVGRSTFSRWIEKKDFYGEGDVYFFFTDPSTSFLFPPYFTFVGVLFTRRLFLSHRFSLHEKRFHLPLPGKGFEQDWSTIGLTAQEATEKDKMKTEVERGDEGQDGVLSMPCLPVLIFFRKVFWGSWFFRRVLEFLIFFFGLSVFFFFFGWMYLRFGIFSNGNFLGIFFIFFFGWIFFSVIFSDKISPIFFFFFFFFFLNFWAFEFFPHVFRLPDFFFFGLLRASRFFPLRLFCTSDFFHLILSLWMTSFYPALFGWAFW